jgi:hypothetical protein
MIQCSSTISITFCNIQNVYLCCGDTGHEAQRGEDKKCRDNPQLMQFQVMQFQPYAISKKYGIITFQKSA